MIKINNRIYQQERANKGQERSVPKKPQQAPRQWYGGPEPMDLSSTREKRKGAYKGCGKIGHYIKDYRSKPREQRPNQGSQQKKMFEWTL